jgi:hypothetical protein
MRIINILSATTAEASAQVHEIAHAVSLTRPTILTPGTTNEGLSRCITQTIYGHSSTFPVLRSDSQELNIHETKYKGHIDTTWHACKFLRCEQNLIVRSWNVILKCFSALCSKYFVRKKKTECQLNTSVLSQWNGKEEQSTRAWSWHYLVNKSHQFSHTNSSAHSIVIDKQLDVWVTSQF